ncbi:MAG: alpha-galactosidase [Chthonomonadales bacterium]
MQQASLVWCALLAIAGAAACALVPSEQERTAARLWFARHLAGSAADVPFSFVYGGRASATLLSQWKEHRTTRRLDARRTQQVRVWTDPGTGLQVRLEAVEYREDPCVEWLLKFRNTGRKDTPILEHVLPLDARLECASQAAWLLRHSVGSPATRSDYAPLETPLPEGASKRISAAGGRPTASDLCYFNLDRGDQGVILALGWPGQWAAEFQHPSAAFLHVTAGQELTHFTLHPGEEVRTPLIVLLHWSGDWIRGQNLWRRWMMHYGMPHPGGKMPEPQMTAASSRAYEEMIHADEASQIMFIDRYLAEGFKLDVWWMDAGWYVQEKGWPQTGTWEVDTKRFPHGFKRISDHAHSKGIRILVWFEPERVAPDTWLTQNHPEWILGGRNGGLLNLGNPEAWHWLVEHIDRLIRENGIDIYRQDFNMDPLPFWRANDAPDRQGITEIKHVEGFLAFWDELRRRHPNMLIDTCASGGRRLDLETLRRSVPLWRSDYAFEPIGHQCMTYGISLWLPYHGTATVATVDAPYYGGGYTKVDPYAFWSNAAPSLGCGVDMRVKEIDYPALRKLFADWRRMSAYYYGDYAPLTPYSQADDAWIAWQFHRPEKGDGIVQVFRRPAAPEATTRLKLRWLDPKARYGVSTIERHSVGVFVGKELMEVGLPATLPNRPQAEVFEYRRLP